MYCSQTRSGTTWRIISLQSTSLTVPVTDLLHAAGDPQHRRAADGEMEIRGTSIVHQAQETVDLSFGGHQTRHCEVRKSFETKVSKSSLRSAAM